MSEFDPATPPVPTPSPAPATAAPAAAPQATVQNEAQTEKQWALFAHLSALTGIFTAGVGALVGPLVIWLVKKDESAFIAAHALEALNFNITVAIVGAVLFLLTLVTFGIGMVLTVPLGVVVAIAWAVLVVIATIKASNGEDYRYPFALRLVK